MRSVSSPAETPAVPRYHIVDLVPAPPDAPAPGNPFAVALTATFWGPEGQAFTIPSYYDAEAGYVVRYSPTIPGADGPLTATWFNPLNGERVAAGNVVNGRHRFVPPWGLEKWAVLHVGA